MQFFLQKNQEWKVQTRAAAACTSRVFGPSCTFLKYLWPNPKILNNGHVARPAFGDLANTENRKPDVAMNVWSGHYSASAFLSSDRFSVRTPFALFSSLCLRHTAAFSTSSSSSHLDYDRTCTKSVSQKIERRVGTKKCNFSPQPPVYGSWIQSSRLSTY